MADEDVLVALVAMAGQYLSQGGDFELDSIAMGAGERAIEVLVKRGLVAREDVGRFAGHWTEAGRAFYNLHLGHDLPAKAEPSPSMPKRYRSAEEYIALLARAEQLDHDA